MAFPVPDWRRLGRSRTGSNDARWLPFFRSRLGPAGILDLPASQGKDVYASRPMIDLPAGLEREMELPDKLRRVARNTAHEATGVVTSEKLTVVTHTSGRARQFVLSKQIV